MAQRDQINGEGTLDYLRSISHCIDSILSVMREIHGNAMALTDDGLAWSNRAYAELLGLLETSVNDLKQCQFQMSDNRMDIALIGKRDVT